MDNVHEGHRKRLREKYHKIGMEYFPPHEILEMLLFYSIPRSNTNVTGHRLINKFGSFSGVFDAPYELLREVDGVGEKSAMLIKVVSGIIKTYMDDCASSENLISNLDAAMDYMRYKFLSEQSECIYMVCLGNNGKILFCKRIADGTPETVDITPADVVRTALRAHAVHVIIAHNHPHGICNPSKQDLRTTNILFDELQRVGVELTDHIIVAADGVYSMKKNNLFPDFWI